MEALRLLGLDEAACRRLGIDITRSGMGLALGATGCAGPFWSEHPKKVLVIRRKNAASSKQLERNIFYELAGHKPVAMSQTRAGGRSAAAWTGELSPPDMVRVVGRTG